MVALIRANSILAYKQSIHSKSQHRTISELDKHRVCLERVSVGAERTTQTEHSGIKWLKLIHCFFDKWDTRQTDLSE